MTNNRKTPDAAELAAKIRRCETIRIWMIVLAAVLLLGGYVTSLLPLMYACVLPLAVAAILTYRIKYREKQAEAAQTADAEEENAEDDGLL